MRTSYSKKHKVGISVLSGLTAALLILTGCSKSEETVYQIPEDRKLIVYTAHKADVYEPIIKEFEERTGIFVELKAGDTLALFDELQQDAPGTFDVMFGGGVENFEECRDYLEPYKVSEIDQIAEQYRTEGDAYTPFSVLPTVFIYNNKLVYPVAAPRTWEELQTDRWKGKIAFADPTKSGSSYTALCTMLQVSDQDAQKTLEEKSLGCIHKGGHSPINAVYDYAKQVESKQGLVIMDTPGNDPASVAAMVAGGAQVIVFSSGRGSPVGHPIAPVVKVTGNKITFANMEDNIDFCAAPLIYGEKTVEQLGTDLLNMVVETACGKQTKAEALGFVETAIARICNYV